ncbi:MAG: AEC family transporter [Desulfobacteraceae bacterium]|nr:MAG: AEC family transporter [Desulfobacteraceae bacterium]
MENLIFILVLLALGKLSRKIPAFDENTANVLNQFVIYLSFPATVFLKINGLKLETGLLVLAVVPWVLVFLSIISVRLISRALGWDKRLEGAVLLSVALGNTSFFGFPAVSAFFGDHNLGYAIIYDQLGTFFALSVFGTIVVSVYGSGSSASAGGIVKKIMSFPPFLALLCGFVLIRAEFPPVLVTLLEGLSATLVPLVIFSVGSQLRFNQPLSNVLPIGIILLLKMIVSPVIAFAILAVTGIRGDIFQVCIFEAAMPPMVMAGILAVTGNLRGEIATAAIGYGILLSFVTLPLLYLLLSMA